MENHLIVKRIRVVGEKNCDYKLDEGLNIFAGSNSTGKTTLLLLIDYIFGSSHSQFIEEVEGYCNAIYVDLVINSKKYTIMRVMKGDKDLIDVFNGHHENLEDLAKITLSTFSPKGKKGRPSISDFFLSNLNIQKHQVKITKTTGKMANFSWRNLLSLIIVYQDGYNSIQAKNDSFQPLMKKAVFEILFDIKDEDLESLEKEKIEIEKKKTEIEHDLRTITKLLDSSKREVGSLSKVSYMVQEIERLRGEKNQLLSSLELKKETDEMLIKKKAIEIELFKVRSDLNDLMNRLEELEILRNENELTIEKNRILMESRKIFSEIPITKCPKCFNILSEKEDNGLCHVCGKGFSTDSIGVRLSNPCIHQSLSIDVWITSLTNPDII